VQHVRVELAVEVTREEDDGAPLARPRLKVDPPEVRASALRNVVQVHEHSAHALAAVCAECAARLGVRVDAVIVLDVALAVGVPRDLRDGKRAAPTARLNLAGASAVRRMTCGSSMWPNGLLVSRCNFCMMAGHGCVFFERWHVSEVRPFVCSLPPVACVFDRCSSGVATAMRCSHSASVRKPSTK